VQRGKRKHYQKKEAGTSKTKHRSEGNGEGEVTAKKKTPCRIPHGKFKAGSPGEKQHPRKRHVPLVNQKRYPQAKTRSSRKATTRNKRKKKKKQHPQRPHTKKRKTKQKAKGNKRKDRKKKEKKKKKKTNTPRKKNTNKRNEQKKQQKKKPRGGRNEGMRPGKFETTSKREGSEHKHHEGVYRVREGGKGNLQGTFKMGIRCREKTKLKSSSRDHKNGKLEGNIKTALWGADNPGSCAKKRKKRVGLKNVP